MSNIQMMKKLFFLFLFLSTIAQSQVVNIPDSMFKARLLSATYDASVAATASSDGTYFIGGTIIDTNGNGEIEFSEAATIDYLNVSTYNGSPNAISSIEGIEAFTNLKILNCSDNNISTLEVSNLTSLIGLNCNDNLLTSLNLSGLNNLKSIRCSGNLLTDIDFSVVPLLESAGCSTNQFVTLDFSNNPFFYDLGAANNLQLTTINLQNNVIQNTALGILTCDGFGNCPNLTLICSDSNEISQLQQMISYTLPNQSVVVENCLLASQDFTSGNEITIYPNPASSEVTIKAGTTIKSIQLFDVQGRIISTHLVENLETKLPIANFSNGIYFIKITTANGIKIQKLLKK